MQKLPRIFRYGRNSIFQGFFLLETTTRSQQRIGIAKLKFPSLVTKACLSWIVEKKVCWYDVEKYCTDSIEFDYTPFCYTSSYTLILPFTYITPLETLYTPLFSRQRDKWVLQLDRLTLVYSFLNFCELILCEQQSLQIAQDCFFL